MYHSNIPSNEELPSTSKLIRSTVFALIGAIILLFTIVIPAEYNIDPTGIGKVLGLTHMGAIKQSLHYEAEADAKTHAPTARQTQDDHGHDHHSSESHSHGNHHSEEKEHSHDNHSHKSKGHHHGDGHYHRH